MAIAFINSTSLTIGTAASTWSIPTNSSLLGGAAFIVGIGAASTAVTVSTVTDNVGSLYLLAVRSPATKSAHAEIWYATNCSSLSTRISVTLSGASSGSIAVGQFSGISTANALLNTVSSNGTANSTTHSAAEFTPSQSSAVVVSYARLTASSIGTVTAQGGMTIWASTAAAVRQVGMYIIQAAASTVSGSFTTSSNCIHAAVMAAFSDTNVIVPSLGGPSLGMTMGYGS